jgi:hypothetical protein
MAWILIIWLTINPEQGLTAGRYASSDTCNQVAQTNFPTVGPYSVVLKYTCVQDPTRQDIEP